jgi:hypothetical protein
MGDEPVRHFIGMMGNNRLSENVDHKLTHFDVPKSSSQPEVRNATMVGEETDEILQ